MQTDTEATLCPPVPLPEEVPGGAEADEALARLAKSTVSQHLKALKEAGLVRGEVEGPRACYCIDPAGLELLKRLVARL